MTMNKYLYFNCTDGNPFIFGNEAAALLAIIEAEDIEIADKQFIQQFSKKLWSNSAVKKESDMSGDGEP